MKYYTILLLYLLANAISQSQGTFSFRNQNQGNIGFENKKNISQKILDNHFFIKHFSQYDLLNLTNNGGKSKIQAYFHRRGILELKGLCNNLRFAITTLQLERIVLERIIDKSEMKWCGINYALIEALVCKFLGKVHMINYKNNILSLNAPDGENIIMEKNVQNRGFD